MRGEGVRGEGVRGEGVRGEGRGGEGREQEKQTWNVVVGFANCVSYHFLIHQTMYFYSEMCYVPELPQGS